MEFAFETNSGSLWGVDSDGIERRRLAPEQRQAAGNRLSAVLKKKRGSLLPIDGVGGVTISDREMFNQLQSLGYIEAQVVPTIPEGPPESVQTP